MCMSLLLHAICTRACSRVGVLFFCYRVVCLSLISEPVAAVAVQDNKKTISLTLQGEGMLWSSV